VASDDIPLSDVLGELRERHGLRVSYARLWAAAVAGDVPAHRVGQRLRMKRDDLPRIAEAFRTPSDRTAA
jgi:hypothetical protein